MILLAAIVGTLSGNVTTPFGSPLSGVTITVSGPARTTAVTDPRGRFQATLPPGDFRLQAGKGGYTTVIVDDVAVFIGETTSVPITLEPAGLTSLHTIGVVSVSRRQSINATAASTSYLPESQITGLANPQIDDLLQRLPETVIQKMGDRPDTSIVLGDVQPYETQVMIDGHPLSMGRYGVWISSYFSSFLVQGVETQTGPGNTTPFANTAVGGTANLLTPSFTGTTSYDVVAGADSYNSQYSHALVTGADGKTQYVIGAGYGSSNGPYFRGNHCVIYPQDPSNDNTPQSAGVIQFCGDSSGSLFTKGELLKLRFNFSQASSLDLGFVGAQGGYLPQGASYGNYIGITKILRCFSTPSSWMPPTKVCSNPADANLVGRSIDGYVWYPGSNVYSNQPIFSAQLRTSLNDTTFLDRPYAGNIERIVDGAGQVDYPYFWGPPGKAFENYCNNGTGYNGTITTGPILDGYEECNQAPFSVFEKDRLYGNTFSVSQALGDSSLTFTWDYHGDNTFAYYNAPNQIAVPDTTERYTTVSLTSDAALAANLRVAAGLYDTTWHLAGSQPQPGATPPAHLVALSRSLSTFNPHVGVVYQPRGNVAYRIAWGTSQTFPFAGQVSGLPSFTPSSATFPNGFVTQKNPYLNPETSSAWNIGGDLRFRDGSLLSLDLSRTNVYDVFETLVTPNAIPNPGQPAGYALIEPINAATLAASVAKLRYAYAPSKGLGYNVAFALASSQVNGIPLTFYVRGASLPANGQQVCGLGATPGTPTCIPYFKGYGQLSYAFTDGAFAAVGLDLEGKNNAYYQPPFAQIDLSARKPITPWLEVQVAVQNLLNTNDFYNLPMPNAGVAPVAESSSGGLTNLPSSLIPAPPRTLRLQLRWHSSPH